MHGCLCELREQILYEAADDHQPGDAQRDRGIVRFAAALCRVECDRDRRWNFQRAGDRDYVVHDAGALQFGDRAFEQRILDVVIKARFDDQGPRARYVGLVFQLCAPRVRHRLIIQKVVIAGLDPAIHLVKRMDTRVKPAYDTFIVEAYFISESRAA